MNSYTPKSRIIDVSSVIDNARVGSFQVRLFAICALCLIFNGFNVQMLGYVAPALIQEWKIPSAAMTPVFAATNFGVLIGALVFGMLADKIGRRPVLIGATFFFSVMTLLASLSTSVPQLVVLRFISGVGLGTILPNATALIGEYSPRKKRVTLMMTITVGFTLGAALAGFISAWMIPAFGWRSVFYLGGVGPLIIGVVMFFWLSESLQFMTLISRKAQKVGETMKQIDPNLPSGAGVEYTVQEENKAGVPLRHLFAEGRATVTILFWVLNFMNIFTLYSLSNWLPTLLRDAGHSATTAVLIGAVLQVGGTVGAFGLAWLIARHGFVWTLTISFTVACISIALIGGSGLPLFALGVFVLVAGWCIIGGQPGLNALSGTYYPTYLRSSGIGAGLGIGRLGGILGPVLAGVLIARQWSNSELFLAAALPPLLSAVVMLSLRWTMKLKT